MRTGVSLSLFHVTIWQASLPPSLRVTGIGNAASAREISHNNCVVNAVQLWKLIELKQLLPPEMLARLVNLLMNYETGVQYRKIPLLLHAMKVPAEEVLKFGLFIKSGEYLKIDLDSPVALAAAGDEVPQPEAGPAKPVRALIS